MRVGGDFKSPALNEESLFWSQLYTLKPEWTLSLLGFLGQSLTSTTPDDLSTFLTEKRINPTEGSSFINLEYFDIFLNIDSDSATKIFKSGLENLKKQLSTKNLSAHPEFQKLRCEYFNFIAQRSLESASVLRKQWSHPEHELPSTPYQYQEFFVQNFGNDSVFLGEVFAALVTFDTKIKDSKIAILIGEKGRRFCREIRSGDCLQSAVEFSHSDFSLKSIFYSSLAYLQIYTGDKYSVTKNWELKKESESYGIQEWIAQMPGLKSKSRSLKIKNNILDFISELTPSLKQNLDLKDLMQDQIQIVKTKALKADYKNFCTNFPRNPLCVLYKKSQAITTDYAALILSSANFNVNIPSSIDGDTPLSEIRKAQQ